MYWPVPGLPALGDSLIWMAGAVPGAEEQAAGDQVELHAAAKVLSEQHRAHLPGLHLCPSAAAGLRGRGPGQAGIRALQPPGRAGKLQEKVSVAYFQPTREPGASSINNLGLSFPISTVGGLQLH